MKKYVKKVIALGLMGAMLLKQKNGKQLIQRNLQQQNGRLPKKHRLKSGTAETMRRKKKL